MILKAKAEGPTASNKPDSWGSYPLYHVHRMAPAICTCMHWMIRRLHDYIGKDKTIQVLVHLPSNLGSWGLSSQLQRLWMAGWCDALYGFQRASLHSSIGLTPPWAGFERIFLVGLCCWPCEVFFQFVLLSALYFSVLFWSALIHAIRLVLIVVLFFSSLTCFWTEK